MAGEGAGVTERGRRDGGRGCGMVGGARGWRLWVVVRRLRFLRVEKARGFWEA